MPITTAHVPPVGTTPANGLCRGAGGATAAAGGPSKTAGGGDTGWSGGGASGGGGGRRLSGRRGRQIGRLGRRDHPFLGQRRADGATDVGGRGRASGAEEREG